MPSGELLPPVVGITDAQYRAIGRITVQFGLFEYFLGRTADWFRVKCDEPPLRHGVEVANMLSVISARLDIAVDDERLRQRWRTFLADAKGLNRERRDLVPLSWVLGGREGVLQFRSGSTAGQARVIAARADEEELGAIATRIDTLTARLFGLTFDTPGILA